MNTLQPTVLPTGKLVEVFFDGNCPLCRREIALLQRRDRKDRITFTNISSASFDPAVVGKSLDELQAQIHGRLPDGRLITGVEVFRQLYGVIGWGWLVNWTKLPGIRWLADRAYQLFAKNRLRLTGRCRDGVCQLPDASGSADLQRRT